MDQPARLSSRLIAAIILSLVVAGLIVAWSWSVAEDRRRKEEIVTAQGLAQVLSATFAKRNELKVGKVDGALDVTTVDPGTLGLFPSSQKVVVPYTVDYTVDLSQLSLDDYRWDPKSRVVTVRIPDVKAGTPNIDETRRRVLDTDGLWVSRRASANLSRRAAVLADRAAAREAEKPEHKAKARDNARQAISSLLEGPLAVAGLGDVKVVVRYPSEGYRDGERWDVSPSIREVLANRG